MLRSSFRVRMRIETPMAALILIGMETRRSSLAPDRPRRVTAGDGPGRHILQYGRSRLNHGAFSDRYSRCDEDVGRNPGMGADLDRLRDQRHLELTEVVARRAEEAVLADRGIGADGYPVDAVAIDEVRQARCSPISSSTAQDADRGMDYRALSEFRAEQAQQEPLPAMQDLW